MNDRIIQCSLTDQIPGLFYTLFFKSYFILLIICTHVCEHMYVCMCAPTGQGIPLELELQVVVSHPWWVLRTQLQSSRVSQYTTEPSLRALFCFFEIGSH